jgi:hypothetical protein
LYSKAKLKVSTEVLHILPNVQLTPNILLVKLNKILRILFHLPVQLATCFDPGFLLGLFLDPKDGGDMFLPNAG